MDVGSNFGALGSAPNQRLKHKAPPVLSLGRSALKTGGVRVRPLVATALALLLTVTLACRAPVDGEQGQVGGRSFVPVPDCTDVRALLTAESPAPDAVPPSPLNVKEYHQYWLKVASSGDVEAMFQIGTQFYDGWGTPRDIAEAFCWWTAAGERGDARALCNLGYILEAGEVGHPNAELARGMYTRAAELGDGRAMSNLANYYLEADPRREDLAFEWAAKSAATGFEDGMELLASLYEKGVGTDPNKERAKELREKASRSDVNEGASAP